MVRHLATLTLPPDVHGFTDDWPLWDPSPSGPTKGRTPEGFKKELKFVIDLWDAIDRKIPIFLTFLELEACATNENPINAAHKRCLEYQSDQAAGDVLAITSRYLFPDKK